MSGSAPRYTDEQREKALALAAKIGVLKASEQLKISRSKLTTWRQQNGDAKPRMQLDRAKYASRDEQQRAVEISEKIGVEVAAKQLGIPIERLYRWRSRVGLNGHARVTRGPNITWFEGFRAGVREGLAIAKENNHR